MLYRFQIFMMCVAMAPFLACGIQAWRHRCVPDAVLLSVGFAVSFVADYTGLILAEQHRANWWVSYVYMPIQLIIWTFVIAQNRAVRWRTIVTIFVVGIFSAIQGPLDELEIAVSICGSGFVFWILHNTNALQRFKLPLSIMLASSVFFIPITKLRTSSDLWYVFYFMYQGVRLTALCLMVRALFLPHLETPDGPGPEGDARKSIRLDRSVGLHHNPVNTAEAER